MCRLEEDMQRVINRNKYIEKNLCITLVIYQECLYSVPPRFPGCVHLSWYKQHIHKDECGRIGGMKPTVEKLKYLESNHSWSHFAHKTMSQDINQDTARNSVLRGRRLTARAKSRQFVPRSKHTSSRLQKSNGKNSL